MATCMLKKKKNTTGVRKRERKQWKVRARWQEAA